MEAYVKEQIKYGAKYLPYNLLKSLFISKSSPETEALRKRGFICGVCHPSENFEQIKTANIGWIRIDIPFPYDSNGEISQSYESFKKRAKSYSDNGLKVMAVTPYARDYINMGIDPRRKDGEERVRSIARFMLEDLRKIVPAFQITNEMGIPHFTLPLTMDEAARFIGIQLEEMYPNRGDVIVGYNSAGPQADLHYKLKPYHKYCDYVGIDIYIGCFFDMGGYMWFFDAMLKYLWAFTGKPILLQEFGYISGGAPKSKDEKQNILKGYGASGEKEARENIAAFVEKLPERLKNHVKYVGKNDMSRYADLLFKSDLVNHLYRELPKRTHIPGYPHTPEGQAKFYADIIPRLYSMNFLCGMFIYCYSDSDECYICGQSDCPTETRWGLADCAGRPKKSYYAVQKAFGNIAQKNLKKCHK